MSTCPLTPPRQKHVRSGPGATSCPGPSTPDKTPARSSMITPQSTAFKTPVSMRKPHLLPKSPLVNHSPTKSGVILLAPGALPDGHFLAKANAHPMTLRTSLSAALSASHYASPERTPRRRRKGNADDMFSLLQSDDEMDPIDNASRLAFGLLIPNHSTVGTGRKLVNVRPRIILESPKEMENAQSMIEKELDFSDSQMRVPSTPGPQVINDELVKHWYGTSYNGFSSDEDIEEVEAKRTMPPNPFISQSPKDTVRASSIPTSKIFSGQSKDAINMDTHMELVNHRTGLRRVVKLSNRQSQIKPKKLDFSQC